jgi:hypothetical protein
MEATNSSVGIWTATFGGFWNPSSATPVTQILLKLGSGNNFPTGSVFTLYGME